MSQPVVDYSVPEPGIARVAMRRPAVRNAQSTTMTYALNEAFDCAAQDDSVKVIVLSGADPHFSAGHDLREMAADKLAAMTRPVSVWGGFTKEGAEGRFAAEQETYLQMTRRWRDLPKPTIAEVQGKCIAGGLMLAWACDIIVASSDAEFCDPVVAMGVCGVEWFAHPWELGARKAKELLFTSDTWSAEEARSFGMVNHVVPREQLTATVMTMARKIAAQPSFALQMAKKAVNHATDLSGQREAMDHAYGLHQLCHAHNMLMFGKGMDPTGLPSVARSGPAVPPERES